VAEETARALDDILMTLDTRVRAGKALENYGLIAVADSLDDAIAFTNDYAPEHLEIMAKNEGEIAQKINNAGSVFIGPYTCKSSGDYATGANHVLPVGAAAKMFSGLSVLDFVKLVEFQSATREGLERIRGTVEKFAEVERLPAHRYSCAVRFAK
jgi:histidinol dehydrogenase